MSYSNNTPSGIEWRYTAKKVRLGPFDAMAVVPPMILFFMNIEIWTFVLAIATIIALWILEIFFRMPMSEARRSFRRMIAGERRSVVPWWQNRRL